MSNKLRFYLRSSRRTEVKHHSTLQRMWGGGKMEENRVFKRKINSKLLEWKQEENGKKALLVKRALWPPWLCLGP